MKTLLVIILSVFFTKGISLKAQCTIDYTQTQPGIYPDTLPDGMVGAGFTEGMTFVMPLDTSGFDFNNFYIQTVSGLPLGLSWQCDSPGTNCNYNPQTSQYGCIEISGTPLLAGIYPIDVSIVATLNVIGDIPANFYTQVVIQPDSASNTGFTASGVYGCSPMVVSFINNNPGMAAYSWDFGNGTTSTQENPAPQTYTTPGDYVVSYEAYPAGASSYFLTNIEVVDADGWSGDLDDGFGSLSPDPYIKLLDQSGSVIYTSPVLIDQDFPVSWPVGNISLQDQTYTVEVWEEDGFWTNDDFCGSLSFQGFST
jgi:PKD repeat protein